MAELQNERVAFFNGSIMPESEVRISFRDRGFKLGDAVFDVARTFDGKPFKLEEIRLRAQALGDDAAYKEIPNLLKRSEDIMERNRRATTVRNRQANPLTGKSPAQKAQSACNG